ncbi:MFS transporter [Facklamia miroungae]|uniref:Major Facilitator Superfamily protein n=1 Tax=Facklamia miroungae TaxID=120956 RepID=A0A1G7TBS4_9LACT|nr:MFS transporter [Facklamia miroungae]NKZ29759.1 MFS transporter [Facklamia miroungae]SDG32817.1 Major Facilitator Superfamily protein [Facklamia miroungae]
MKEKKKNIFKKDFTLVVIGQIISLFGNAILRFALPLYLLRETGSATIFGVVTAISFIPMVILSLIGGILADRLNKRNIMVILDFTTAALMIVLYITFERISIVPLFITMLMLLYGISGTYQPSVQASLPLLVDKEYLVTGNAIINQVNTLANLLGPVIGGILFGFNGLKSILLISILCFTFSAVIEIFVEIPFVKRKSDKRMLSIAKDDLIESYKFVKFKKPIFFSIGFIVSVFNFVLTAVMIVGIPIIIVQILKMSDLELGISQGILALGGLFGGILAATVHKKLKLENIYKLLIICGLCVGVMGTALLISINTYVTYLIITIMCFCSMSAATLFTIQIFAMVQAQTPSELIGKIMATLIGVALSAQPLGQAIYGVLFDRFAGNSWLVLFGSSIISIIVAIYSKRVFRNISVTENVL